MSAPLTLVLFTLELGDYVVKKFGQTQVQDRTKAYSPPGGNNRGESDARMDPVPEDVNPIQTGCANAECAAECIHLALDLGSVREPYSDDSPEPSKYI